MPIRQIRIWAIDNNVKYGIVVPSSTKIEYSVLCLKGEPGR